MVSESCISFHTSTTSGGVAPANGTDFGSDRKLPYGLSLGGAEKRKEFRVIAVSQWRPMITGPQRRSGSGRSVLTWAPAARGSIIADPIILLL
jgi:hypothetical protein